MTGEDAVVHAEDCKHDGDRAKSGNLETVHSDGVRREGVYDAEDEEELEKDGKPGYADISDWKTRVSWVRMSGRDEYTVLWR